jgi:hypothetical protein
MSSTELFWPGATYSAKFLMAVTFSLMKVLSALAVLRAGP